MPNITEKSL